jgi:hypothetical protein
VQWPLYHRWPANNSPYPLKEKGEERGAINDGVKIGQRNVMGNKKIPSPLADEGRGMETGSWLEFNIEIWDAMYLLQCRISIAAVWLA